MRIAPRGGDGFVKNDGVVEVMVKYSHGWCQVVVATSRMVMVKELVVSR